MDNQNNEVMNGMDDEMKQILERLAGLFSRGAVDADELGSDLENVMKNFKEEHEEIM